MVTIRNNIITSINTLLLLTLFITTGCELEPPGGWGVSCPLISDSNHRCAANEYCKLEQLNRCISLGEPFSGICKDKNGNIAVENANGFGYCLEDYACKDDGHCLPYIQKNETACHKDNYETVCAIGAVCTQNLCKCGSENCGKEDGMCCRDEHANVLGCFDLMNDKNHCGDCRNMRHRPKLHKWNV